MPRPGANGPGPCGSPERQNLAISPLLPLLSQTAGRTNARAGSPEIAATTSDADAWVALSPNWLYCR